MRLTNVAAWNCSCRSDEGLSGRGQAPAGEEPAASSRPAKHPATPPDRRARRDRGVNLEVRKKKTPTES